MSERGPGRPISRQMSGGSDGSAGSLTADGDESFSSEREAVGHLQELFRQEEDAQSQALSLDSDEDA